MYLSRPLPGSKADPPPPRQKAEEERHTPVKTLSCPILCMQAVIKSSATWKKITLKLNLINITSDYTILRNEIKLSVNIVRINVKYITTNLHI